MEITREYARKLIRTGKARMDGRTVDQGWIWEIITRVDRQRTDHAKIERTTETVWSPSLMGRKGGAVKSERKTTASRENGKKGGRPKKKDGKIQ